MGLPQHEINRAMHEESKCHRTVSTGNKHYYADCSHLLVWPEATDTTMLTALKYYRTCSSGQRPAGIILMPIPHLSSTTTPPHAAQFNRLVTALRIK